MKRIETFVLIQMPLDQVFDYLIEPANLPHWAPGFLAATSTSKGPISRSPEETLLGLHPASNASPNSLQSRPRVCNRTSKLKS